MTPQQWADLGWTVFGYVAPIIASALAVFAVRWLQAQANLKVTDNRSAVLHLVGQVAVTAVTAAEQTLAANPDKKAAALKLVSDYLAAHSINVPVAQIDAAIESAVLVETQHKTP